MTKHSLAKISLASTLAMALATPAWAQDSGSGDDGDIIVTARRSEEKLQDVPISITVLNKEDISKRNLVSTADLGTYVPSLSVNSQFGPEKSSFVIRGFTQEYHTAPTVGVYFADVIAPRALGPTTSGNGAGVGSLFDLENIQVLKGPQGTLFGRNTTGGAILLVPAKPTDKLEGFVEGSVGGYNLRRVQAVLNAPLSDTIRLRGGIDWNQRDGYLMNHSGIGPDRYRDTNYIAARLSLVADLTPDIENYTIGTYSHSNTKGDVPRMAYCNRAGATAFPTEVLGFNFNNFLPYLACAQIDRQAARGDTLFDVETNNPNPRQQVKQWGIFNTTTWKVSDNLTVKNIISYQEYREWANFSLWGDNLLIPAGTPFAGVFLPPVGAVGSKTIALQEGNKGPTTAQSTFTEEIQVQGTTADGKLNWQAGAYLEVSKPLDWNSQLVEIFINCTSVQKNQCSPSDTGSISDASSKDWFNNKGLYAQATYKFNDQFAITGGFRYTWDKQRDEAQLLNVNFPTAASTRFPGAPVGVPIYTCQNQTLYNVGGDISKPLIVPSSDNCNQTILLNNSAPTWMIDLEWKPTSDILVFAKYARGYRAGSITNNSIGLERSDPEKVDSFEVGAKTSFRGAMPGYFNITWFYNNLTNQQLATNSVINRGPNGDPAAGHRGSVDFGGVIPPAAPTVNAGKSRIWGIEVDAAIRPFDGFKMDVGYTYLNTRLVSFTTPPVPIYYASLTPATAVGGPLPLSPKNRITLTGTYTLPLDEKVGKVSIGATFTHTDANEARSQFATPAYLVEASNHLNVNVDWNNVLDTPLDLSFFMTNVTNEAYIVFPSSSFFTFGGDGGHVNEPRMWGFRLKYRFGD
ncbi:MAG: TonB-dependent receptor [Novosphingobium sp.]